MHPARWEQVKGVFAAALERAPADRARYVADACAADAELREEVESLLAEHDPDDAFMETPAFAGAGAATGVLPAGGRVGPYRLVREIGRGGMGAVYLAERDDGQFRQQVAVKLVKRGMDTDLILRRFRHERQILAELDHPNIARLLDGGTTADGLPYFVMELIEGEPIDRYCAARSLGIPERLALFRDVCAAVQFAHQRLVVHRDIKPANVLVTASGVPKLLDFGIAKLLTTGTDGRTAGPTELALRAMTPEYASPEQVRGEAVTTLSDVYSLGVMLYELLAGAHPYATAMRTPGDLAHAVTDTEPARPSAVAPDARARRRLRGDLDTIVLGAMRKEPARRYASAEQLSDDVRRYLAGLPVRARPDTLRYRATTFVRRNRLGVAAAGVVLASLVGGIAATTYQARVARAERARAERRFAEVRTLATSFLFELHDAIAKLPGATPARALLVRRALASLDGLAREAGDDRGLQRDLAAAYERIGRVQGNSYDANLGDTPGALASYRKSVAIRERLARDDPASDTAQNELAGGYEGVANMLVSTGDLTAGLAQYEHALQVRRGLLARHPANEEYRSALAQLHHDIGDTQGQDGLANLGDAAGALASYRASVRLREATLRAMPNDVDARVGLANSLMSLGYLAATAGERGGADDVRRAIELLERVVAERPDDAMRRTELISGYALLRQPLVDDGRVAEAIEIDRKLIAAVGALSSADSTNTLLRRNLGVGYNYLGRDLRAAGRAREAVPLHRRALAIAEGLVRADPQSTEHRHDVAMTHHHLAGALADAGDAAGAASEYRRAATLKERMRVAEPSNSRHGDDLALIYTGLGDALGTLGDLAAADEALRRATPLAEAAAARSTRNRRAQSTLASTYLAVGRLQARHGATAGPAARQWFARGLAVWQAQQRAGTLSVSDSLRLARASREAAQLATK